MNRWPAKWGLNAAGSPLIFTPGESSMRPPQSRCALSLCPAYATVRRACMRQLSPALRDGAFSCQRICRAAPTGSIAGSGRYASGLGGVAGGSDEALPVAARPAAAAAVAGVGQPHRPQPPDLVLWLCAHGVMPLYTPVGGSWLNMAESIERVLKRRALDGQHPHSPDGDRELV